MNSIKTDRQIEFAELMNQMGWRPVDVARELGMSKAQVSQILSGIRNPGPRTLELFRRIVTERKGEPQEGAHAIRQNNSGEEDVDDALRRDLQGKLDDIAALDPRSLESVRVIVDALHQRVSNKETIQGVAPEIAKIATNAAPGALAKALREHRERSQKHKAALTSENKSGQERGAARRSEKQPESPAQAPKSKA